jgi:hypothetical protein
VPDLGGHTATVAQAVSTFIWFFVSDAAGRILYVRNIDTAERRARLARRHALADDFRVDDVVSAAKSVVCFHATDPATVYLSARARVPGLQRADVDSALYEQRSLVKHLSMRRTLFVFARENLADATAGPGARVAEAERRKTARDIEAKGISADGTAWLETAEHAVLGALVEHGELSSTQLREAAPIVDEKIRAGGNGKWGQDAPVGPRLLTILSASGQAVRGRNQGTWNVSRPLWAPMTAWLGEPLARPAADEAMASMVRAWLASFGPGTINDIKWWLGATAADVRRALAAVEAVPVTLDDATGFVLPDDLEPVEAPEPWGALLPALDPTTMGWTERDWYLGPHRTQLFDNNGNAGPTVWWNGRVVGGWHQEPSGEVRLNLLEEIGPEPLAVLNAQAAELSEWLSGQRVLPRFPSPLFKSGTGR